MDNKYQSRSTKKETDATLPGVGKVAEGGAPTIGENVGAGSRYSATLREHPNQSLNRNAGPERPDANPSVVPTLTQAARKTGRVGG